MISENLLNEIVRTAEEASARILEVYNSDNFDISQKDDASPLTRADIASNECIFRNLRSISDLPVLSEESDAVEYSKRSEWNQYWLIDPLDGTKEFIKRNDEFTVNIALVEESVPVLGVVCAPALKLIYAAAKGIGARRLKDGVWQPIHCSDYRGNKLRIVASRSHGSDKLKPFLDSIGEHELVSSGSSLKLCRVAEGEAHLYPRLAPTMEWDTAAAHAIVLEAGGHVVDLNDCELRYNKPNLLNPEFIVTGKPAFPWQNYLK